MFDGRGMDIGQSPQTRLASRRVREQGDASDDDALMSRIAQGDRDAAQTLMTRHLPRILGLAGRTLAGRAGAGVHLDVPDRDQSLL